MIDERDRWLAEELREEGRLPSMLDPTDLRTKRERTNDLREIAKNL